jgi:hypothetical protein
MLKLRWRGRLVMARLEAPASAFEAAHRVDLIVGRDQFASCYATAAIVVASCGDSIRVAYIRVALIGSTAPRMPVSAIASKDDSFRPSMQPTCLAWGARHSRFEGMASVSRSQQRPSSVVPASRLSSGKAAADAPLPFIPHDFQGGDRGAAARA